MGESVNKSTVIFYESLPINNQIFLHRFIVAQITELIEIGYNIILCTGDNPNDLKEKFIDFYNINAVAINCNDYNCCKKLNPVIVFTSRIDSAVKIKFTNIFGSNNFTKILWYGGVIPEESYLRRKSKVRRLILLILEKMALKWADIVLLPTQSMLNYLDMNNRLPENTKYLVVPNAIEASPPRYKDSRKLWGIKETNSPVIGYCGGLSKWQCFEETLDFIKNIQAIEPDIIFLVITYDPQNALKMIFEKGISNAIVKHTTPDKVYQYVQAFDVGILFRYENVVNTAAFPLKYLDYISNGVPVITTNAVKAITSDVQKTFGYTISFEQIDYISIIAHIKNVSSNKESTGKKLREHVTSKWTFDVVNKSIRNVYTEIYKKIPSDARNP